MADVIDSFTGRWRILSNFSPHALELGGIRYPTSEHAFQALKTLDPEERAQVAAQRTPGAAKRLGRHVQLRRDWPQVRFEVMHRVLVAKFAPYTGRRELLVATGDARIIEGNVWHDQLWGDCRCGREECAEPGENRLGILLQSLRWEIRRGRR